MALFIPLTHGKYFEEEVKRKNGIWILKQEGGELSIIASSLGECNKMGFADKNTQGAVR